MTPMASILLPINLDRYQRASATLLRELAERCPECAFHSFSKPETSEDQQKSPALWAHEHLHQATRLSLLTTRFDIVHTATATRQNSLAVRLAKLRGRSHHLFTANTQINRQDPLLPYFESAARTADTVVAVSQAVADDLAREYGVEVHSVIPNGVDDDLFDGSRDRDLPDDLQHLPKNFFVFIGTVEQRKRPDLLIEVARRCPDQTFVVAGGQADQELIDRIAAEENIVNSGARTRGEVRDIMSNSAGMVFPSDLEGLPLSVIEAMAMGLPVLARPVSSLPELVEEGVNGFLIDHTDMDDWAKRVEAIASWTAEKAAAQHGLTRASVVPRYSYQAIADSYRELYQSIANA